jgi:hypothetical protein
MIEALLNTHQLLCKEFIVEYKMEIKTFLKQTYNKTSDSETDAVIEDKAIRTYIKTLINDNSYNDIGLSRYMYEYIVRNGKSTIINLGINHEI